MGAVLPVDSSLIDEFEVRLAHESRRLKRPRAPFTRQVPRRDRPQFLVDDGDQAVKRLTVAALPALKEPGDIRVGTRGGHGLDCAIVARAPGESKRFDPVSCQSARLAPLTGERPCSGADRSLPPPFV